MKLVYENIGRGVDASFNIRRYAGSVFDCPYHFHPEVELTLIENSHGTRLIGGNMARFGPGDLVLIPASVPHWYYNNALESEGDDWARSVVVQFRPDFLGEAFLRVPEMASIHRMLEETRSGVVILGELREELTEDIMNLLSMSSCERLLRVIKILNTIAEATSDLNPLDCGTTATPFSSHDARRLDKVFRYIHENFSKEVSLDTAASIAGMASCSFSRYFRLKAGRTFQMALIQARIVEACQRLVTSDASITEICYACGFNNLSNFNRRFKSMTGVTPKGFRQRWKKGEGIPAQVSGTYTLSSNFGNCNGLEFLC